MKGGTTKSLGFTLIETLIVLAVTSAMFVTAAIYVAGRQNKIMFTDAIQDVRARILQVSNEVAAGYYPSMNNFTCTVFVNNIEIAAGNTQQGANNDCTFLGKSIVFGVDGDKEAYRIENLVGKRVNSDNSEPVDLKEAAVSVLSVGGLELSDTGKLKNGLSVAWMKQFVPPPEGKSVILNDKRIIGLSVVTSAYNQISMNQGILQSGTIVPSLVGVTAETNAGRVLSTVEVRADKPGVTTQEGKDLITKGLRDGSIVIHNPAGGLRLCFASGTTEQSGLLKVGGNNRVFTVDIEIIEGRTCGV